MKMQQSRAWVLPSANSGKPNYVLACQDPPLQEVLGNPLEKPVLTITTSCSMRTPQAVGESPRKRAHSMRQHTGGREGLSLGGVGLVHEIRPRA